jgi:tRNA dimethylallyltransferase
MTLNNKHLVVIAGPTASGKTEAAIQIARHFQTEIISADSRQIYKETRIGTAVPEPEQLAAVKHHFIQTLSLNTYYNASMFEMDVLKTLESLFQKHNMVIMAGGSGMYIEAVCSGIDDIPTVDPAIRERLSKRYYEEGLDSLTKELRVLDPESHATVDLNNPMRVLKALEVTHQTGRPYSHFLTRREKHRDFNIVRIALNVERQILYRRINARVDRMLESGLIDEVKSLMKYRNCNAMKTVGYKEIMAYLDDQYTLDEAITAIKNNTRKYARKQITWFRKNQRYRWTDPEQIDEIIACLEDQCAQQPDP